MSPTATRWRMSEPCADCPFNRTGPGARLAKSLAPARMAEIKRALMNDESFFCHKTTDDTGNGTNLICAGALAWQESHGASSQYARICERLDYFYQRRKPTNPKRTA